MLAFGQMLLAKGAHGRERILSRPAVELMTTDQLTAEQKAASPFFEHFWSPMHKAVFFALLGVSFWMIGSRAETIWTLGGRVGPAQEPGSAGGATGGVDA